MSNVENFAFTAGGVVGGSYLLYYACKKGWIDAPFCRFDLNSFGSFVDGVVNAGIGPIAFLDRMDGGEGSGPEIEVNNGEGQGEGQGEGEGEGTGAGYCKSLLGLPFSAKWQHGTKQDYLEVVRFDKVIQGVSDYLYKGVVQSGDWANWSVSAEHRALCKLLNEGKVILL